ncbi:hypothetical protein ASH00_15470 [Arthrobacter sp. Soil782]|uniref:MvaI/BcnI family restriction endonuclease n=1 Tax=Arthrobacter sp. Soil782 TaxID=1736410 RepID=UPI0006FB99F7|nr:MvaI/BcnI family restriction endonuclease [Arthrobacter sp. Soil782]KRF03418.1 hypothetical protein ASH00_15470 [Arthrobacter sp. Soil782]
MNDPGNGSDGSVAPYRKTDPSVVITLTKTMIDKMTIDASARLRAFFSENGIHDYFEQPQGPEFKRVVPIQLVSDDLIMQSEIAFYRPRSGKGDPRMRISSLHKVSEPGDKLEVSVNGAALTATNISRHPSSHALVDDYPIVSEESRSGLQQLLSVLETAATKGYIRCNSSSSNAVGNLLESLVGIRTNSSRQPDYFGIELKTRRATSGGRHTILAKAASWSDSPIKSTAAFLDVYGYYRASKLELNCEVRATPNSLGLWLTVSEDGSFLEECSNHPIYPVALRWKIRDIEEAIASKHEFTLWVTAETRVRNGVEEARFTEAILTRRPNTHLVASLFTEGHMSIDHLASQEFPAPAKERGPLLKIDDSHFENLFPIVGSYRFAAA